MADVAELHATITESFPPDTSPNAEKAQKPRKQKKKLTPAQRADKKRSRQEFMTIFINGKQKRVRRPQLIDGMDVDEFILRNADPIWLHQNEMWEYIEGEPLPDYMQQSQLIPKSPRANNDDEVPF